MDYGCGDSLVDVIATALDRAYLMGLVFGGCVVRTNQHPNISTNAKFLQNKFIRRIQNG